MTTAKDFRAYAAECMEAAKAAETDGEREALLQMATDWLRAASLSEPMTSPRPAMSPNRHRAPLKLD
jgi:hypothetical protein